MSRVCGVAPHAGRRLTVGSFTASGSRPADPAERVKIMPVQPASINGVPTIITSNGTSVTIAFSLWPMRIQYRVETWHRPPRDEEDDSRPDYGEILQRRFDEAFDRPLDHDLQRFDFARALIWLQLHAPLSAAEAQRQLDALRDALDPDKYGRDPDLLDCAPGRDGMVLSSTRPRDRATTRNQAEQPKGDQDRTGSLPAQSGSAKLSPRELASKHGVAQRALQVVLTVGAMSMTPGMSRFPTR